MSDTAICPRCRALRVNGVCPRCVPQEPAEPYSRIPAPDPNILPTQLETRPIGLVGLQAAKPHMAPDRSPVSSPSRASRFEASEEEPVQPEESRGFPVNRMGAIVLLVIAVIGLAVWFVARASTPEPAEATSDEISLPSTLTLPASSGRAALLAAMGDLDALTARAQVQLLEVRDTDPKSLSILLTALGTINGTLAAMGKDLNQEERTVAAAMIVVARQLHAFISSYGAKLPDFKSTSAREARDRISDARILLTGTRALTPKRK